MFPKLNSVSGFWTGLLVHQSSWSQVNVSIVNEKGSITGAYDLPESVEEDRRHGTFTGRLYGHWINVRLSQGYPGAGLEFHVTLLKAKGHLMMYGVIPLPDASIPFATITLFRGKSPDLEIGGAWPFLEVIGREPTR